jgi:hypothetical protein
MFFCKEENAEQNFDNFSQLKPFSRRSLAEPVFLSIMIGYVFCPLRVCSEKMLKHSVEQTVKLNNATNRRRSSHDVDNITKGKVTEKSEFLRGHTGRLEDDQYRF